MMSYPGDPEKGERSSLFRVLARTPFNSTRDMTSEAESAHADDEFDGSCVPDRVHVQWTWSKEVPPLQNCRSLRLACNSSIACVFSNRSAARLLEAVAAPSPAVILPRSHPGAPLKALLAFMHLRVAF